MADVTIMCLLGCKWMVRDAKTRGMNPWQLVGVTLVAGSFGPLAYLLLRELRVVCHAPAAA